jgi:hypothetical protein
MKTWYVLYGSQFEIAALMDKKEDKNETENHRTNKNLLFLIQALTFKIIDQKRHSDGNSQKKSVYL